MTNIVKVLAFAGARDVVGAPEVMFELEQSCTADELMDQLCSRYPALLPHRSSLRLAINQRYALAEDTVQPGDEVALIPPVAGG